MMTSEQIAEAWKIAADDLGFTFTAPFELDEEGRKIRYAGLVREFGSDKSRNEGVKICTLHSCYRGFSAHEFVSTGDPLEELTEAFERAGAQLSGAAVDLRRASRGRGAGRQLAADQPRACSGVFKMRRRQRFGVEPWRALNARQKSLVQE